MSWFNRFTGVPNSFNTNANYNAIKPKAIEKEATKIEDIDELKRKLEKHYNSADEKITRVENVMDDTNHEYYKQFMGKIKAIKQAIQQQSFPKRELDSFKGFIERNTQNIKEAIVHLTKLFVYIINTPNLNTNEQVVTLKKEYTEKSLVLVASIKDLSKLNCDRTTEIATMVKRVNNAQTQKVNRSTPFKCPTPEVINGAIQKLEDLYKETKSMTNAMQGGKRTTRRHKRHNRKTRKH
jgi:hypothetical protein